LPSFPLTMLYSVKSANNKQAVKQGKQLLELYQSIFMAIVYHTWVYPVRNSFTHSYLSYIIIPVYLDSNGSFRLNNASKMFGGQPTLDHLAYPL